MRYRAKEHWGSHLWSFIHTITIIDFENSEIHNNKILPILNNLKDCIPCYHCKELFIFYLNKLDKLDLKDNMILFKWSVDLHNHVNKKLNKPEWTYETALDKWTYKILD
jgi:hypothetical protein